MHNIALFPRVFSVFVVNMINMRSMINTFVIRFNKMKRFRSKYFLYRSQCFYVGLPEVFPTILKHWKIIWEWFGSIFCILWETGDEQINTDSPHPSNLSNRNIRKSWKICSKLMWLNCLYCLLWKYFELSSSASYCDA